MDFSFYMPARMLVGDHIVEESSGLLAGLGSRCLLVTGKNSARLSGALGDVTAACQELFGPDCALQPANPKQETFFTFDNTDNQFHVAPYSSQSSYTPYTESERRSGDSILLRVGYLSPADEYFSDETGNTAPSPAKYMEYELKTNPDTGK